MRTKWEESAKISFHEAGLAFSWRVAIFGLCRSLSTPSPARRKECGAQQSSTEFELEPLGWIEWFAFPCAAHRPLSGPLAMLLEAAVNAFLSLNLNRVFNMEKSVECRAACDLDMWGSPLPSLKRVRFLSAASGRKRNDDSIQTGQVYTI